MNQYEEVLQYPQIAIALEDIKSNTGKFYIPSIMPTLGNSNIEKKSTTSGSVSTLNGNLSRVKCNKVNYIELEVPDYIRKVDRCQGCTDKCEVICNHGTYSCTAYVNCKKKREIPTIKKGTKFIVVFVGGDVSKARIIGVY